jgi:glycosyltransferase involved in cell wall biosynthesis
MRIAKQRILWFKSVFYYGHSSFRCFDKISSKSTDFNYAKVYFSMMKRVLFIGLVFPESKSTAAGTRMLQLISFFKEHHYQITFASAAQESPFSDDLVQLDIEQVSIELNNASFDTFVKELNPELVVFDRFIAEEQFGWRVAENCPNAIRVLDTEDLHCLRMSRQETFKKSIPFEIATLFKADVCKREIASIYRCDLSLIISSFEFEILTKQFKISKDILLELPFMLDRITEDLILKKPSFEKRVDFISIGNFKHEPNWQSVLYLKKTIWPLIKKELPTANLLIYGAYATQKVTDLRNEKEGFLIKGRAEAAHKVIEKSRVLLAPLQFGAGLKGKLIDAMQSGTPSVTTAIGAEGMHENLPWNGFITDTPEDFASKTIELYTERETWINAQQNGIKIINELYDKTTLSNTLLIKFNTIQKNIMKHRNRNFIGSLLQHHTLQSTKYMSKWIEEKNA